MEEGFSNPFERGPYVTVAAFCERVLTEGDNVVSLIRLIDRITQSVVGPNPSEEMPEWEMPEWRYPLTMFIELKPGSARGRHEIVVAPELPSGETISSTVISVNLEGENRGQRLTTRIDMPFRMEGLYWFNVYFDNQVITRLPLEVRYQRFGTQSASQDE